MSCSDCSDCNDMETDDETIFEDIFNNDDVNDTDNDIDIDNASTETTESIPLSTEDVTETASVAASETASRLSRTTSEDDLRDDSSIEIVSNPKRNESIQLFMETIFKKTEQKQQEFSDIFDNPILHDFNIKKHFDTKHTKFSVDCYGLLIRENKYNQRDPYGWVLDAATDRPVNINVTSEMKRLKSPEDIFDTIMMDLAVNHKKINLTPTAIPTQVFKILQRDVSKYKRE